MSRSKGCEFPAIYNFGDSNSDTGGMSAAKSQVTSPNGETFFRHPAGRSCDGRLIIDFIAKSLKLPYLSAYLDSIGTNFRHGANFATGGSSVRPGGYSPFHLAIQISQFIQFKSRTIALYNQLSSSNRTTAPFKSILPRPQDFSKALYTIDIGQNDLYYGLNHTNIEEVRASIPDVLNQFSQAVQQLYQEEARFFWIHNTGPVGCLPYSVIYDKSNHVPVNLDRSGCVKSKNEVTQEFNKQLKNKISELRVQLPNAALTYVDVYSVKYALVRYAKNQGFVDPLNFCCGSYYGFQIDCGKKAVVNGTVYGNPCDHPSMHIFWDGFHYSEAANLWVANRILNGSFSDPSLSIHQVCFHPRNM
ncbi:GDSL esterase/lipase At5g14450-like [Pistacia vera]|uniref:GDSL esterase/lipase At5g14450-like n=1 Tax=Pistacia vera TaxID=55513 RepID=UPI00126352DC|nr:GDSL esterase/lipase At5g14450-like [Pistacia vera]